jgi:hypothetical protein
MDKERLLCAINSKSGIAEINDFVRLLGNEVWIRSRSDFA